MIKFEPVSRFADAGLPLPTRSTANSAGYDFVVAEDITIEPMAYCVNHAKLSLANLYQVSQITLEDMKQVPKKYRPALVSTGMKCYLDPGHYLELSMRSSTPLKYWLILANGVGIIDADYADNDSNEGEIFFQIINLNEVPITLHKGDRIGQGIIKKYYTTDDDAAQGERKGGFGSTNE